MEPSTQVKALARVGRMGLWLVTGLMVVGTAAAEMGSLGEGRSRPATLQQLDKQRKLLLLVGWHDEMNAPGEWRPFDAGTEPGFFASRPGAVTLRLPEAPEGFPYSYQWGGVTRPADVDLSRYPVVVAFVSRVQEGSYAHLDVEERDHSGRPVRTLRSPTVRVSGLTTLDLGREWGGQTRRLHLRLIVGGPLSGASCEYAWVRFIRRDDLPRLRAHGLRHEPELKP